MQTMSILWEHSSSYEKYLYVGLIPGQIGIKKVLMFVKWQEYTL